MTKIYLYGEYHEVFDEETKVSVPAGARIVSLARAFLVQTPDRKEADVVLLGTGGEAYALNVRALRLDDGTAEAFQAQLLVVEADRPIK
jgi:hypothetical protein